MAMSACSIRLSAGAPSVGYTATPMLQVTEEFLGAEHDRLRPPQSITRCTISGVELLVAVLGLTMHDEFVARQARHGVGVAQRRAQARGDRHQQHVAGLVAHAVVDELEAVEVDQHDPHRLAAALGRGDRLAEAVLQQAAVGQAGQHVVLGDVVDALFAQRARQRVVGDAAVGGRQFLAALVEQALQAARAQASAARIAAAAAPARAMPPASRPAGSWSSASAAARKRRRGGGQSACKRRRPPRQLTKWQAAMQQILFPNVRKGRGAPRMSKPSQVCHKTLCMTAIIIASCSLRARQTRPPRRAPAAGSASRRRGRRGAPPAAAPAAHAGPGRPAAP